MNVDKVKSLVQELVSGLSGANLLPAVLQARSQLSPDEQELFDAFLDLHFSNIKSGISRSIVVAMIHGIRTNGAWQDKVRASLLGVDGIDAAPLGYGFFDVVRFLSPFRDGPLKRVQRELRDLRALHPDSDLVVVAHSFGTYIVAKTLENEPDINISRLILCGSIIPENFRWDKIRAQFTKNSLVNDVGTKDFLPVLARFATWGYGCSGTFGFKSARTFDRYFEYSHSDFFSDEHIEKYWMPFIKDGVVIDSPYSSKRPSSSWFISLVGHFPLFQIPSLFLIVAIIYGAYSHYNSSESVEAARSLVGSVSDRTEVGSFIQRHDNETQ